MRTDLQVEGGDVELSGAGIRLEVRPKHLPEHTQHLRETQAFSTGRATLNTWPYRPPKSLMMVGGVEQ